MTLIFMCHWFPYRGEGYTILMFVAFSLTNCPLWIIYGTYFLCFIGIPTVEKDIHTILMFGAISNTCKLKTDLSNWNNNNNPKTKQQHWLPSWFVNLISYYLVVTYGHIVCKQYMNYYEPFLDNSMQTQWPHFLYSPTLPHGYVYFYRMSLG